MNFARRLIEVPLPLAAISEQSARETSIRHEHISALYIYNAYAGKYLFGLGLATALTALIFDRVPGITLDAYALACGGIILAALTVCVACSFRHLAKLTHDSNLPR
jgi:hypothetical protein